MTKELEVKYWRQALAACAAISLLVSCLVLALLLVNYLHRQRYDPLATAHYFALQEKLAVNPKDEVVKKDLREIDLQVRREYYSALRSAKQGSWLLLGCIMAFMLFAEAARRLSPVMPRANRNIAEAEWLERALARYYLAVMAIIMAGILITMAFFSRNDNLTEYARALGKPMIEKQREVAHTAPGNPATATTDDSKTQSTSSATANAISMSNDVTVTNISDNNVLANVAVGILPPFPSDWEANWPQFRGPSGIGVVRNGFPFPQNWDGAIGEGVRWKSPVPLPGENSPIIWGTQIFLSGADKRQRQVYSFDRDSGKLLWTLDVNLTESAKTVAPQVMDATGYAASTMACDGTRVFALFANGDLIAIDFSGKKLWSHAFGAPDNAYGHAASLLAFADRLIVQYDQGHEASEKKSFVFAFANDSGKKLWQTARPVPNSWCSPIYMPTISPAAIICAGNPWVMAYNPINGQEIWRVECLSGDVAPSPVYEKEMLFVAQQGAGLSAIVPVGVGNIGKAAIRWQAYDNLPDTVSPLTVNGLVLITAYATVTCYDAGTGKLHWEHYFDDDFYASPVAVKDKIYLLDGSGIMHIINAERNFTEIATLPLGEKVSASPAFVDGHIYIRAKANLYCIGAE